jgi:hypothetical protein
MVADDVLTGQPDASMQPDLAAPDPDPETWVIDMWNSDVRFLITPASGSADAANLEELASGVRRAASRFWLVDEAGDELPAEDPLHDLRTPDVVLGPLRFGSGIVVSAGTKDGVTWPLGRAFVEILREELERLTVDAEVSCLPSEVDVNAIPAWE